MKIILFTLLLMSGHVLGHGNIDNKNGACTLKIAEERAIHLTAYQPSTHEGEVFCQDAPDVVETILVLDFMEADSKKNPFSFSIGYFNEDKLEPIAALPLQLYPKGSMLLKFLPKAAGKYHGKVMFLDKDGQDSSREFDFYIGERSPNSREPSGTQQVLKWLVVLLFVLGGTYFVYMKIINKRENDE